MPRRWHQRGDDASHHAGDGGKKARSPGRARKKPLKPFAQGMPGKSGEPVVTTSCVFLTRNCGCASGARHSLRPLILEGRCFSKTRACERRGRKSMPEVSAQTRLSCPDLIRASIELHKNAFERGWIAGSSPAMTKRMRPRHACGMTEASRPLLAGAGGVGLQCANPDRKSVV